MQQSPTNLHPECWNPWIAGYAMPDAVRWSWWLASSKWETATLSDALECPCETFRFFSVVPNPLRVRSPKRLATIQGSCAKAKSSRVDGAKPMGPPPDWAMKNGVFWIEMRPRDACCLGVVEDWRQRRGESASAHGLPPRVAGGDRSHTRSCQFHSVG